MALAQSPKIVTNGLVMYYDMANNQKSWKGAPTTNLVNPSWASWSVDGSGQGSIGTRTITTPYECLISDTAANTRQNIYVTGIAASTTYTFSVQYKKQFGAPTLRFQLQAYNGGSYISTMIFATTAQLGLSDIEGWQTAKYTVTTPAGTTQVLWFMQDGDDYTTYTHSFMLANPQCEQQSFATPFVAGTRSNTQAIVDLTGNNTVAATSLTYAADNTFSFNGSSDYIFMNNNTALDTQTPTVDVWIKTNATTQNGFWFEKGSVNTQYALFQEGTQIQWRMGPLGDSISYATASSINTAGYFNVVATRESGNQRLYINGVNVASGTQTGTLSTNSYGMNIGRHSSGYYYNGRLPMVKVYNRALTAPEVQQNFNAHRGRYGL